MSTTRYRPSHEWVRTADQPGEYLAGITRHAEHALGDVVFVELPAVGKRIAQGQAFGVVESVKAASDLYMPMSGTITAVNDQLGGNPGLVNADCSGEGWMIRFKADTPAEWDGLLDEAAYNALLANEA